MTERKILSSIRLNLIIVALAILVSTNVFYNFLNPTNPTNSTTNLNDYLSYGNLSTMFVGLASLLLATFEIIGFIRNKPVSKFFTLLKFVATIGSLVSLLYSYLVYLPLHYESISSLDAVLLYNGPLFTKTIIPLLACYSLIFTDSYNNLRLIDFVGGALLPGLYGAYHLVEQLFFDGEVRYYYFDFVNSNNRTITIISTISAALACFALAFGIMLLFRLNAKEETTIVKEKVIKEKKKKDDSLNFATIEDNEVNNAEPFEFGQGRKPEQIDGIDYTSSLTDILADNKDNQIEESPELSKEISFSLENDEVPSQKELSPLEKLSLSLDEQKEEKKEEEKEKVLDEQKEEKVEEKKAAPTPTPVVKPVAPMPKLEKATTTQVNKPVTPLKKEEKKEEDFNNEKQVKNDNPLSVKTPSTKKTSDDKDKDVKGDGRVYHIGKQKTSGKWQVKLANGERAIRVFDTQKEAIECAKELIKTQGGSYRIHSRQGKIRKE